MNSFTLIVPGTQIRPRSLRSRSISIICSARSLGCLISSNFKSSSSALSCSLGRVPAIGRVSARPFFTRIKRSGDELIIVKLLCTASPEKGAGFVSLNFL